MPTEGIEITVDGEPWVVVSEDQEYDAVHTVAGALLAGAEEIHIERFIQDE